LVEDSPALRGYWLARILLTEVFGETWVRDFVCPSQFKTFLLNNAASDFEVTVHLIRVVHLAEMLWNSQSIPGYGPCIKQLRTPGQIESTYAELDIARLMIATGIKFVFNERRQQKGRDFDLLITFPTGLKVCGETKCKVESTTASEQTIISSLEDARNRNLPSDQPGIIFAKVPADWIRDDAGAELLNNAANRFLTTAPNIVSVKFFTSTVMSDGVKTREALSWYELPNADNRFDPHGDWRLFPRAWESSSEWNGMPPHWKRIMKGDWL
jgi:hypothetical protein